MFSDEMKAFLDEVASSAVARDTYAANEKSKSEALAATVGAMTDDDKEAFRKAMDFTGTNKSGKSLRAMDAAGQEHSLDPERATREGYAVDGATLDLIQRKMEELFAQVAVLKAKVDAQGQPLFTADEIVNEVFTPLVREGLLPDALLTNAESEVAKLLGASFGRYKETLEEARAEKEREKVKTDTDFRGGGTKMDMLKATGGKLSELQDRVMNALNPIGGTLEEKNRSFGLASTGVSTITSVYSGYSAVGDMVSGAAVADARDLINGVEKDREASTFFSEWGAKITGLFDGNPAKASAVAKAVGSAITKTAEFADEGMDLYGEVMDMPPIKIALAALAELQEAEGLGQETVLSALEIAELRKSLAEVDRAAVMRRTGAQLLSGIDQALVAAVGQIQAAAGAAIGGLFQKNVKLKAVVDAGAATEPNGQAIIDLIAKGLRTTLAGMADGGAFTRLGQAAEAAFTSKAKATQLQTAISEEAESALDTLLPIATTAIQKALNQLPGDAAEDTDAVDDVAAALSTPEQLQAITAKATAELVAGLPDELNRTQEEIDEYERSLVMIDDAGMSVAQQRSLDQLIAKLEDDRKIINLVTGVGSGLTSLGIGATEVAGATGKVGELLLGEIAGPLKAAKLIIQLSASLIKAAERWRLWYKFQKQSNLAKVARSSLSSTIRGFYENKKKQVAMATIEEALLLVNIAGAITGSVPHPITIAVGKTLSACAEAASAAAEAASAIYDEVKLREAWNVTKAALDNPADRSLGLKALRLNTTLAMHAIAWAGLKSSPDPIARSMLRECGLNEHTLSDGGTTEGKVRAYLMKMLDEDRVLLDTEQIKTNWQPSNLDLSLKSWVVTVSRAERVASPKMAKPEDSTIRSCLRKIDAVDLTGVEATAQTGALDAQRFVDLASDVQAMTAALNAFSPRTTDGIAHEEMAAVIAQLLALANSRGQEIDRLQSVNARAAQVALLAAQQQQQAVGGGVGDAGAGIEQGA